MNWRASNGTMCHAQLTHKQAHDIAGGKKEVAVVAVVEEQEQVPCTEFKTKDRVVLLLLMTLQLYK